MRVAVLGATGLVGGLMLELLAGRPWCDAPPAALASDRSAGRRVPFAGGELPVRDAAGFDWSTVDLVLMSAGAAASRTYAPAAVAAGCRVVDNSSAWRMDPDVPLVVPEINAHRLPDGPGIVANPNCSTIQVVMAAAPLQRAFGLEGMRVATYQAVSGAGRAARAALLDQLAARRPADPDAPLGPAPAAGPFARPVALDAVPEIGDPLPDGSFTEEAKVVRESRKILERPTLRVSCLAVRVPSWNGHGAAVWFRCGRAVTRGEVVAALADFPGVSVAPDPHAYTTPAEATGADTVHVGRVRVDPDDPAEVLCWITADNLRKGAAANAVQIADRLAAAGA